MLIMLDLWELYSTVKSWSISINNGSDKTVFVNNSFCLYLSWIFLSGGSFGFSINGIT